MNPFPGCRISRRLASSAARRSAAAVAARPLDRRGERRLLSSNSNNTVADQQRSFPVRAGADRPAAEVEKDWFRTDERLAARVAAAKQRGGVHFVFLEGPAGAGKGEILRRLDRLGYSTVQLPFADVAARHPPGRLRTWSWLAEMLSAVSNIDDAYKTAPVKDAVAFVGRSPLSTEVYAAGHFPNGMEKIRESIDCSVVLCKADPSVLMQRVAGRYELSPDEQKAVRSGLGEPDDVQRQSASWQRYDELESAGAFDATLATTSTKQAAAAILRLLGLGFKWPASLTGREQ